MGRDIKSIIGESTDTIQTIIQILERELDLEEVSPLINQIIETHRNLEYKTVVEAFNIVLQELKK